MHACFQEISKSTMAEEIGGGGNGSGGGGGGTSRYAPPPPPFLTKTFQIVNDPNTNPIISWGKFGDSFIIWDHLQFTAQILPKYFKHNNFSSYVYQLNNYGFRKIGVENEWEYANPNFQQGKQHLLSNMRRRPLHNPALHRRRRTILPRTLKDAIDESKQELEKLKMQQLEMDFHITAIKQKAKNLEFTSKKLISTLAKACEIISKREGESCYDDDVEVVAKRKKVVSSEEIIPITIDEEENEASLSEKQPVSSSSEKETIRGNYSNIDLDYWMKKMLEDDEVCEGEGEGRDKNLHDKIAQDFHELLTKEADLHYSLVTKIG